MEQAGRPWKLLGVGMAVLLVLVGIWLLLSGRRQPPAPVAQIQEVTLTQGERSITLNRGGTLTVRIPEGVFQQQWDEEKVAAFFAKFESQDWSAFSIYGEETEGYRLSIVSSDGTVRTVVVPFLDVPLPEVVAQLATTLTEISEVASAPTPTPTPRAFVSLPTPVPTTLPTQWPTPGPTPTPIPRGDGGGFVQRFFECDFTEPASLPDILSQTVCTIISSY